MDFSILFLLSTLLVLYLLVGIMLLNLSGLDLLLWDWYTDEAISFIGLLARLLCWPYVIYKHFDDFNDFNE